MAQLKVRTMLWIDSAAGALSGANTLLFGGWIAAWAALPQSLLTVLGCTALAYACYSGGLAWRGIQIKAPLMALVAANAAYAVGAAVLAALFSNTATALGIAYLLGDAGVVAILAAVEWRIFRRAVSGS